MVEATMPSSVSIEVPPDLVENVARGSCMLFLGADYSVLAENLHPFLNWRQ
jgi:hypothetical protein